MRKTQGLATRLIGARLAVISTSSWRPPWRR